jgi:hypothetical protein
MLHWVENGWMEFSGGTVPEAFAEASKRNTAAIIGVCRQMSLALRFRWKLNVAFFLPLGRRVTAWAHRSPFS